MLGDAEPFPLGYALLRLAEVSCTAGNRLSATQTVQRAYATATAIGAGMPSIARTGVAKADPPAPNIPNVIPTPKPAAVTSSHVTLSLSARGCERSKT